MTVLGISPTGALKDLNAGWSSLKKYPLLLDMITGAFYDPETEGIVYWVPPRAEEPVYYSDDEASDSGDSSGHTISSCEVPDYFREINGRLFVDSPDVPVWYPVDELRRPKLRHQLLKLLYGENHFGPMSEVLSPRKDYRPRVLDLCTRDGSWVREMAQEFPHARFVSVDVAPIVDHVPRENIVFEVYDIQQGILELDDSFDLVRISCISEVLKDIPGIIREARRVLKPGGLLCVIELEHVLYDSQDIDRPSLESTPLTWRALDAVRCNLISQGVQLDAYQRLESWLSPDSILWKEQGLCAFQPFERVMTGIQVAHAGGWDSNIKRQEIRLLLAQLSTVYWRNMAPMLAISEMCDEDIMDLVNGAVAELKNPCTQYALKFHHVFGYKSSIPCGQI